MIKYIHGLQDSIDIDTYYVFDSKPDKKYCQEFCASKDENKNIIVIKDNVVSDCYKGTVDEVNNGLYYTYSLHEQEYPLLINKLLERDVLIKDIRVLRCLLSHFSRTQYRDKVKFALNKGWSERVKCLKNINLDIIDNFEKNGSKENILKIFAFQLGQSLGLHDKIELYTKNDIAIQFPELKKYLYRENNVDINDLKNYMNKFINIIENYEVIENNQICNFPKFNKTININNEGYL